MFTKNTFIALLSLACCCVLPQVVAAQVFEGVQVDLKTGKDVKTVFQDKDLFDGRIDKAWNSTTRALGDKAIEKGIAEANAKMPKGINLYHQKSQLSGSILTESKLVSRDIVIGSTVKRNVLTVTSTTPTVLGSWADPTMAITYDLRLDIVLRMSTQGELVPSVVLHAENVQLDSKSLPADLIKALDAVNVFFGGKDFIKMAEAAMEKPQLNLSAEAKSGATGINATLAQLRKEGYTKLTEKVVSGRLVLTIEK